MRSKSTCQTLISAVRETGSPVLWVCDPMHGNTESTADGTKTRRFDKIVAELEAAFRVHTKRWAATSAACTLS